VTIVERLMERSKNNRGGIIEKKDSGERNG
jgi:hypothetical protein